MPKGMMHGRSILRRLPRRSLMSSPCVTEWSPSIRPWRMLLAESPTSECHYSGKKKGPLFWHVCLPFAVTLPACHLSTCAQGCLQWWAPYWLTSMPTTLTPPRRPTTSLPLTALLLQTSGWVTAESTSQNQCSAAGATVMFKKEEKAEMYPCFSLFFCCCNFLF